MIWYPYFHLLWCSTPWTCFLEIVSTFSFEMQFHATIFDITRNEAKSQEMEYQNIITISILNHNMHASYFQRDVCFIYLYCPITEFIRKSSTSIESSLTEASKKFWSRDTSNEVIFPGRHTSCVGLSDLISQNRTLLSKCPDTMLDPPPIQIRSLQLLPANLVDTPVIVIGNCKKRHFIIIQIQLCKHSYQHIC